MIFRALSWRPIVRRPLRFATTVLGVTAGVAAVVATLASSRAAIAGVREGVIELAGRARLEITRPGGLADGDLARFAPLITDAGIAPVVEEVALCTALSEPVRLLGIDPLVDGGVRSIVAANANSAERDSFETFLRGGGAWISAALARELALKDGDRIVLDVRARRVELAVLGTFAAPATTTAFDRTIFVDIALAQEIAGKVGHLDRIELVPRAGVDVESLRARAASLASPGMNVAEPSERAAHTAGLVRSLEFNLTALSGISLVVGAVLVATTLATSVVQRRRTIALLRALGASPGQIARAVLAEAAILGVFGGSLGVLAGGFGAQLLLPSMRATVSTVVSSLPEAPIKLGLDHALIGLALGLVTSLAAALLPVIEAARTPPIQALRGETPAFLTRRSRRIAIGLAIGFALIAVELANLPAWRGLPVAALLASLALLGALFAAFGPAVDALGRIAALAPRAPPALRLACAALSAGRRRAAWAAGAVGVAVALSISIATMVTSFRTSVVDWTHATLKADLSLRPRTSGASSQSGQLAGIPSGMPAGMPIGRLDPDLVGVARATLGDDGVDPFYSVPATFAGEPITFAATALTVAARHGGFVFTDGREPLVVIAEAAREHEAIVNEEAALRFGWRTGDTLELSLHGVPFVRHIAGVYRDYSDSQGTVLVDELDFALLYPGQAPRVIACYAPPGESIASAHARLAAAIEGHFDVDLLENETMRAVVLSVFDRTFAITQALQSVAALVAVVAVLSVLYALVAERSADLALIVAIGAHRGQVLTTVALQAAMLGLLGAAGGGVAGLVIGLVLVKVVNLQSFGWTIEFLQPWSAIVTTLVLVTIACAVAGLFPARAAARAQLREALREE